MTLPLLFPSIFDFSLKTYTQYGCIYLWISHRLGNQFSSSSSSIFRIAFKYRYSYFYYSTLSLPYIIPILPNIILILKPLLKDLNNARDTCDIRSEENFFPLIPRPRKRSRSTVSRYRRGRTMIFQSKVIAKRPSQRKVCEQRN